MRVWDQAIRRPTAVAIVTLALCAVGALALGRLTRELWPQVSLPFCTVTTVYPGAGAAQVEGEVTQAVEARLGELPGLAQLASQSRANVSVVMAQFTPQTSTAAARAALAGALEGLSGDLPSAAAAPQVGAFDITSLPVLAVALLPQAEAEPGARAAALAALRHDLTRLPGVARVQLQAPPASRELQVVLDPQRLGALGLPASAVVAKLRAEHLELPLGQVGPPGEGLPARLAGHFASPAALAEMVLAARPGPGGGVVRLSEVAELREADVPAEEETLYDGAPATVLEVVREAGADILTVAAAGRARLDRFAAEESAHWSAHVVLDQGRDIGPSLKELAWALIFGGLMAVLVVWLFLADARGTLITALALPTSVLGTLAVMWAAGFSLNQVTLLSLSLAIGLLIDDAVVVRESIARRLDAGVPAALAASQGTAEVALAVTATTFTLCAVFVPLAFMQGLAAQFFRQFGLTMAAAVLISLVVAFTLDPMLSARRGQTTPPGPMARGIARALEALERAYAASLRRSLPRRGWVAALGLALCLLAGWGAKHLRAEFIAGADRGLLSLSLTLPPGSSIETARSRTAPLLAQVRALPEVAGVLAHLGAQHEPERASWRLLLTPPAARQGASMEDLKARLRALAAAVPDLETAVAEPPLLEGVGAWPAVVVRLLGQDADALAAVARAVGEKLAALPGIADLQVHLRPSLPELVVTPNRDALARGGLTAYELGVQLRLQGAGESVGRIAAAPAAGPDGQRPAPSPAHGPGMNVRLLLDGAAQGSPAWAASPVFLAGGSPAERAQAGARAAAAAGSLAGAAAGHPRPPPSATLGELAQVERRQAPAVIEHASGQRSVSLSMELASGADLGTTCAQVRDTLAQMHLPADVQVEYAGQQADMQDMVASTKLALMFALLLVYVILAVQFESWLHPLTIMLACPLALVGAVAALLLGGHSLSMGSCIGIVLLLGLVTKNAILLVNCALELQADGGDGRDAMGPVEAMVEAGARRLRPILMTSSAMVLGMLPAALMPGQGAEFRAPMAQVVIGGVIASTLLTLWVVPAVFALLARGGVPKRR